MSCRGVCFVALILVAMSFPACLAGVDHQKLLTTLEYDFSSPTPPNNWSPIFADYNAAAAFDGLFASLEDSTVNTTGASGPLSSEQQTSYFLQVSNRADDIYFGIKGLVTGLPPSTKVKLVFDAEILSNVGPDCFGVGGSPGNSVWFKLGASAVEPSIRYEPASATWRFIPGVSKGEQLSSGPAGSKAGDVAVEGGECGGEGVPYRTKAFTGFLAKADAGSSRSGYIYRTSTRGELWLLAGFESGFEGNSALGIKKVGVKVYRA